MPAHVEWMTPAVRDRGSLRFGTGFKAPPDAYPGAGVVDDFGNGVCGIGPIACSERMTERDRDDILQWLANEKRPDGASRFNKAWVKRINTGRLRVWEYDLTSRQGPFKMRPAVLGNGAP